MKIRNISLVLFLIAFNSIYLSAESQYTRGFKSEKNDFKRVEFGPLFGFGSSSFNFKNSYSDSYTSYWYDTSYWTNYYTEYDMTLAYSSSITGKAESNFAFGGFLNFFFIKNFGLQIMAEGTKFDIPLQSSHSVDLSFSDYSGGNYNYTANPSIEDTTGKLSIMPISFNLYTRFDIGKNIIGYASGGLTYYKVAIKGETRGGAGVIYQWYDSSYDLWFLEGDSVLIPLYIDDSYSGLGANIGGGLSFQIQKNLGIIADIRYYLAPKGEVAWIPEAGNYKKVLYDKYGWTFGSNSLSISQAGINDFLKENERYLQVKVDPSYFHISMGLIFRF